MALAPRPIDQNLVTAKACRIQQDDREQYELGWPLTVPPEWRVACGNAPPTEENVAYGLPERNIGSCAAPEGPQFQVASQLPRHPPSACSEENSNCRPKHSWERCRGLNWKTNLENPGYTTLRCATPSDGRRRGASVTLFKPNLHCSGDDGGGVPCVVGKVGSPAGSRFCKHAEHSTRSLTCIRWTRIQSLSPAWSRSKAAACL